MKAKIKQNVLMYLLGQQMSDLKFFGSKLAAMVSLWLCCRTGRWLNKKGLLPEIKEDEED